MPPLGQTQLDRIEEKVTELSEILTGNGDTAKGLVVRVSRVEDRMSTATWVIGVIIVAAVGVWMAPKVAEHIDVKQPTATGKP